MPLKFMAQARQHIAQGESTPDEICQIDRWADDYKFGPARLTEPRCVNWQGNYTTNGRAVITVQQAESVHRYMTPVSARLRGVLLVVTQITPIEMAVPDYGLRILWMMDANPAQAMRAMQLAPPALSGDRVTRLDQRRYYVLYHAGLTFKHVSASFRLFFC